ncbi:MAG: methyltransferase domain-containing protein [Acidobacteriota bacterium]
MIEFTGERVVPGQVDVDLWNEHVARYAFASRLTAGKRVLDAGCGSGYGSAELARTARAVVALDIAGDAVREARAEYCRPNITHLTASCAALPLADASIDVAVVFEVIEHIPEWQEFLREARRVLVPGGVLVISTPNKDYYADTRRESGPNPYHVHEFTFDEFASELKALFPEVALYTQNHAGAIAFERVGAAEDRAPELCMPPHAVDPATAHFFLAVCSAAPQPFLYVPTTANVLRERELHIDKLEADVRRLRAEKQELVDLFRAQKNELDDSNRWAGDLDNQLTAARARIVQLQEEVEEKNAWALGLEAKLNAIRSMRVVKVAKALGVGPRI